jgi:antitoxin (DNA-binding transcriptional repressor) of toxin-antitoxin stability system
VRKIEVGVAQADLARLVEDVAGGKEIVLAIAGKPLARLVAFEPRRKPREPGSLKGKIWIAVGFDDPVPEQIMAAFCGQRP